MGRPTRSRTTTVSAPGLGRPVGLLGEHSEPGLSKPSDGCGCGVVARGGLSDEIGEILGMGEGADGQRHGVPCNGILPTIVATSGLGVRTGANRPVANRWADAIGRRYAASRESPSWSRPAIAEAGAGTKNPQRWTVPHPTAEPGLGCTSTIYRTPVGCRTRAVTMYGCLDRY